MTSASVHETLVAHLRAALEGRAVIADVAALGTEQVVLLVELDRDNAAGPPRQALPSELEPETGAGLELRLFLAAGTPNFWVAPVSRRRALSGGGFGDWLRLRVQGGRVLRISAGDSNRVLRIDLADARDGRHMSLILDPLPTACRVLVLDAQNRVEQRFPAPIHASSAGRGTPDSTYEEPAGAFSERWERLIAEAKTASVTAGAETGAGTRVGAADGGAVSRPQVATSDSAPLWVCELQPTGEGEPEILLSPREGAALAGSGRGAVRTLAGPCHPLAAARICGELSVAAVRSREARRALRQALKTELKHMQRLSQRIGAEIVESGEGADLRRQAEALLAQAGRIPKGAAEIEIPDISDPGRMLRVGLDPARSFADNVNRLFRRAGRLERSLAARVSKRDQVVQLTGWMESWLARIADRSEPPLGWLPSPDELRQARAVRLDPGLRGRWDGLLAAVRAAARSLEMPLEHSGYESRRAKRTDHESGRGGSRESGRGGQREGGRGGTVRSDRAGRQEDEGGGAGEDEPARGPTEAAAARAGIHPRRFVLPDGWVVLVGRSNAENDALTHQAARQRDLWFHARGVAGSHVVLQRGDRKDNPSKASLDMAASIAAFYSKARTSRHAPVIHTEKRYVRKPRKAPPGLAVCLREKVLMVEPKLPPGSAEEGA